MEEETISEEDEEGESIRRYLIIIMIISSTIHQNMLIPKFAVKGMVGRCSWHFKIRVGVKTRACGEHESPAALSFRADRRHRHSQLQNCKT